MAGYDGYSMSNNARMAYQGGYKPLSKWTKKDIIAALVDDRGEDDFVKKVEKYSVKVLRKVILEVKEWHHTSKEYNRTNFYGIVDTQEFEREVLSDLQNCAEEIEKASAKVEPEERWEAEFAEWSGSRNHPKKTMVTATGTVRRNWFYLDNGGKKRTDGNWFKLLRRI